MDGTTSIRPAECLNASSIRTFLFCTSFTKGEVVMTAVSVLSIPDPYSDNSNKVIYNAMRFAGGRRHPQKGPP